jgi:hypothetical protein
MEVKKQWRQERQPNTNQTSRKRLQCCARLRVVNLRINRQQRSAVKQEQRERQKEKHALKIPLPSVAKDYHHPEQHQQRSQRKPNQPDIA